MFLYALYVSFGNACQSVCNNRHTVHSCMYTHRKAVFITKLRNLFATSLVRKEHYSSIGDCAHPCIEFDTDPFAQARLSDSNALHPF